MSDAVIERQARSKSGFIRAYGMFWSANEVDWTGATSNYRLEILGRVGERRPRLEICNFWEQRGIYVLYNHYGPYYVGRTSSAGMSLGKRLRQHYEGATGSPTAESGIDSLGSAGAARCLARTRGACSG